jgi:membrane-bound lytic murein transglycosylase D
MGDLPAPPVEEMLDGFEADSHAMAAGDEPAAVLADSLEGFESATVFWEQGSPDDAFAALDRAYELMASVPTNGDPQVAQEKENLRHLISRRVVEIYASRQTSVGDVDRSIPRILNDDVRQEIARFQGPERTFFLDSYRRSGRDRPMIVARLQAAGLPEQLSWLPLVESGFKSRALSSAHALGLWQFISSTGYRYGLERSSWVDERLDPEKATEGAIGYLSDLHGLFGDWLTALAAYNCGERAVLRQIQSQPVAYFDRFWDLYQRLPRETRRYVPRFLAVLAILEDPAAYGFDLPDPDPAGETERVEVARSTDLGALAQALGLEPGLLADLNPELRLKATPPSAYPLRVPAGSAAAVLAHLAELPEYQPPQPSVAVHRVRSGETLSGIAGRYGTTVRAIMDLNHLRSAHRIWPGQQLRVTGSTGAELYVVRRGDTMASIARRQRVQLTRLLHANDLSSRSTIYPGQQIVIPR